jgi:transposase
MDTGGLSNKGGSKVGRKLVTLTNIKKKELCEYKIANPTKTNEQISKEFGIGKTTVGDIIREKEKWLAINADSDAIKKRDRKSEWPQLEDALTIWIDHANRTSHTVNGAIICQKAMDYARRLDINGFTASPESINFILLQIGFCT